MKANRTSMLKRDTSAQVGIGTLIIFIAMVLVAAIAAAVLIQTSGVLQQKAQSTGEEATAEVSSNMKVLGIEGVRADDSSDDNLSDYIDLLEVQTSVSAGGDPMDLGELVITISDGTNTNTLTYNNSTTINGTLENTTSFTATAVRDEDESFSDDNPVMNKGDLIKIYISSASGAYDISGVEALDSGLELDPRTDVRLVFTPEAGTPQQVEFTTPSSYSVDTRLGLFP
ncbi:archaellin/type IV pilin N-terminal domain-containing protein [Methanohalophilus portucalensis]|uniref:Flagellin n=2 Tax=Methanohalophilus portucalensis TaxID=39664 RepID=A0A1L9C3X7_9EURY|nr:archaellin/type IV pilin N-terminal domain-containing protein [Methanohalophilus portucalensis]ATU07968.1 flagellin [Methanohalophilus portucalensis]OJH49187.1 hypothetical protein MPF_1054 [Methanohalophilus portucalensis FDF-1]RNI11685.1 flagellin [Methanohalophilus portucalensis FDF-1]SMH42629.1 flagellin FlaB [Methanohalophilus portucalensis FDF-1]